MAEDMDRRQFLGTVAAGAGALTIVPGVLGQSVIESTGPRTAYRGPNVIVVRFGGGVRRRETIDPDETYAPFLRHDLAKRGTLYTAMTIAQIEGLATSHGEGTLNILTGKYDKYTDVDNQFLRARFEPKVPTIFEYLRKTYAVPAHQTLIINSEDRTDEEFYTFSNSHTFGVDYRSTVLSLYRYKTYLLRDQIAAGMWTGQELEQKKRELRELTELDIRATDASGQGPELDVFWSDWRRDYGDSGFKNPRGDRLLTELAVRAIDRLRPKLMMIHYQDPDYVHWGNLSHYTRGIAIIDEGLRRLVDAVDLTPGYRDNTVFVIVPDCGRDDNRFMSVPCQHHFNSKAAHEIWALLFGPGITKGVVVDKPVDQTMIAATVGRLMGFEATAAEGGMLQEAFV